MTYGTKSDTERVGSDMRIVAALLLGLVSGSVAFALTRWHPSQISTRMERFDTLLSTSGVEPGERVRDILEVQAVRRHVLGAFGGGVGYAVTFTASLLLGSAIAALGWAVPSLAPWS
jgi:hypothetical protein